MKIVLLWLLSLSIHASASGEAVAEITSPQGAQQLGTEQANDWMPVEAIALPTEAARRASMLKRIRSEVERRHSSLDLAELDRVLAVMNRIPRERFVEKKARRIAYLPTSLDIGFGQTITDAYIVAVMTAAAKLQPDANVLDIGTGSGYQAAVLAGVARHVTSIEIVPQLSRRAGKRLRHLGYRNIEVIQGDGFLGSQGHAPFDAIIVAAGASEVPSPLIAQLKIGGRLILPIGPSTLEEQLLVITKTPSGKIITCSLGAAAFVPLTGRSETAPGAIAKPTPLPLCYDKPVT